MGPGESSGVGEGFSWWTGYENLGLLTYSGDPGLTGLEVEDQRQPVLPEVELERFEQLLGPQVVASGAWALGFAPVP
jgi:hypothetical protein